MCINPQYKHQKAQVRTEKFDKRRALRDKLQQKRQFYETVGCFYYNGTEMYVHQFKTRSWILHLMSLYVHASPNYLLRRLQEVPKRREHLGD
jgi:hypothetical protein